MNAFLKQAFRGLAAVFVTCLLTNSAALADPELDPPGRVARINLAEGPVSVQSAGSSTWSSDVANRPLTTGDRIWADRQARAELHIGSAAIRLGAESGLALGTVDDRSIRLQLNAGALQLRVRALGPDETFEITTPFATVAVLTPGNYRLDVSDRGDEMRVAVQQGQLAVTDGSGAITVDAGRQTQLHGSVATAETERLDRADALDQWAAERDRREDRSVSTRYVSREVIGYEDLDDYGTWQVVDDYGPVWRPNVSFGWSPYRHGHWMWVAPWGWTWIDDAPWGFAPFHYGRWVNLHGNWCWTPGPRHGMPYYAPALVGWVGGFSVGVAIGGPPVAWFPLGWNEVYVPSYRGSRQYVENLNVTNIHVTNVVVNQYYDRARGERDEHRRGEPREYRNFGVSGAVVSTTRDAFSSGQPVHAHPADLPRVDRTRVDHRAPDVTPSAASFGRPAVITPRQDIFTRPVMGVGPSSRPNADGPRPELRNEPVRGPDYRPAIRAPEMANPTPAPRLESPRPEMRPGMRQDFRPGTVPTPDYRPSSPPVAPTAPATIPVPENRYTPPRNEWHPSAVPDTRPSSPPVPDYRPAPPVTPSLPTTPAPENRYTPPRNEWRPEPTPVTPPPERHYEAPRMPEYHPVAPSAPIAPPAMREYRPPAPASSPPPVSAPARPQPAPKDDRRDRPH